MADHQMVNQTEAKLITPDRSIYFLKLFLTTEEAKNKVLLSFDAKIEWMRRTVDVPMRALTLRLY